MDHDKATAPIESAGTSGVLISIQALRGVAVTSVVLMHACLYLADRLHAPGAAPRFEVGAFGVDLFFVISGFVMVYASARLFGVPGGTRIFLLRRLVRIVPMYWIATTVLIGYLIIQYGGVAAATMGAGWDYVAASYLFVPVIRPTPLLAVGWTLNYEMFFYLVFGALVIFSQRTVVVTLAALFTTLAIAGLLFAIPEPYAFWFSPISLEFALGACIALAYRNGIRLPLLASGAMIATALAVLAVSWGQGHAFSPGAWSRLAFWGLPAGLVVAAFALSRGAIAPSPFWRVWTNLGDASYSLYLFHTLTIPIPRILMGRFIEPASWPWLYLIAMLVSAIVPALLIHHFIELPLTARLRRAIEPARRKPLQTGGTISSPATPG